TLDSMNDVHNDTEKKIFASVKSKYLNGIQDFDQYYNTNEINEETITASLQRFVAVVQLFSYTNYGLNINDINLSNQFLIYSLNDLHSDYADELNIVDA